MRVSAFEVYFEKAGAEVLHRNGYTWKVQIGRTPGWLDMVAFFTNRLDIEVDTGRVQHVRKAASLAHALRGSPVPLRCWPRVVPGTPSQASLGTS
jgi:hypothetical protein